MNRILTFFILMGMTFPLWATMPEKVVIDSAENFLEGEAVSTSIRQPGTLTQGLEAKVLADLKGKNLWNAVWDAQHKELIIATGPEGLILAVDTAGHVRTVAKLPEPDVYTITLNSHGELFAATSPRGKVYQVNLSNGQMEIYFDPKTDFIWDLLFDKSDKLYVATGTEGKIYQVTDKNKAELYFDADEPNIRCLAMDANGKLLAGTSDKGMLYRIQEKQNGIVLFQAERPEIRRIVVDPEGVIYFAVNGRMEGDAKSRKGPKVPPSPPKEDKVGPPKRDLREAAAAARMTEDYLGAVYRLKSDAYPEKLGALPCMIHSMALHGSEIWVGTGNEGYLFSINGEREWSQLGKTEAEQVTGLIPGEGDVLYGITCNAGAVIAWREPSSKASVYRSKVIGCGLYSRWGMINIEGKGRWKILTRTGNTMTPDKSWYPWVELSEGRVASPQSRYLQFEIDLVEGHVDQVTVASLSQNLPPMVKQVGILENGIGYQSLPMPPNISGPKPLEMLLHPPPQSPAMAMKPQYQPVQGQGLRSIAWDAEDPNEDELEFRVEVRFSNETKWTLLKDKVKENLFVWDTNPWAEGKYYIRVTVSDAKSNPAEFALKTSKESEMVTIDHTPPKITILEKTKEKVRFSVADDVSFLKEVAISIKGGEYKPVVPVDGILDGRSEEFEVKRKANQPLLIRASDEMDNTSGALVPEEE